MKHTCTDMTVAELASKPCWACEADFISGDGFVPREKLRGTSNDVPSAAAEVGIRLADSGPRQPPSGGPVPGDGMKHGRWCAGCARTAAIHDVGCPDAVSWSAPPWLPQLLAIFGWQGGTIHQALDEVRKLRDVAEAANRWRNSTDIAPAIALVEAIDALNRRGAA